MFCYHRRFSRILNFVFRCVKPTKVIGFISPIREIINFQHFDLMLAVGFCFPILKYLAR